MTRRSVGAGVLAVLVVLATLGLGIDEVAAHTPHDIISDVVVSPSYAENQTVFTISGSRLQVSTDGGKAWSEIVHGLDVSTIASGAGPHQLQSLAIAPSDERVMYMTTRGAGIFRSGDSGRSWERTSTSNVDLYRVAVSPTAPRTALVTGTFGGLFRTTDGGDQWLTVDDFGRINALTFLDGDRALVGGANGRVSASDDGGVTWTVVNAPAVPTGIMAFGVAPGTGGETVFAGGGDGELFRSDDGGATFSVVGDGLPREAVLGIAVSPDFERDERVWVSARDVGVFRSDDGGATFTKHSVGLTTDVQATEVDVAQFSELVVAADGSGGSKLFLAAFDGMFVSDSGANRWRAVETQGEYVISVALSPNYEQDGYVAATTYLKGAYVSSDHGQTWARRDRGLEEPLAAGNEFLPVRRLHNIHFSPDFANDNTLFSAIWTQVIRSTDRGMSWEFIPVGAVPKADILRQFVFGISPQYASNRTLFVGTRLGEIYRSTEGGDAGSWEQVDDLDARVRSIVVSPTYDTEPVVFANTVDGTYKSTDAGDTWARTGPPGIALLAMSPAYATDGTVFAGTEHGVYVTRDEGNQWTALTAAPLSSSTITAAIAVSPTYADDGTVLVSALGIGLFRSTDRGESFVEVGRELIENNVNIADFTNPTSEPIQFSPTYATDRTIYGTAQTNIVRSTDGGDTWTIVELPPASEFPRDAAPAPPAVAVEEDDGIDGAVVAALVIGIGIVLALALGFLLWRSRRRPVPGPSPAQEPADTGKELERTTDG